MATDSGDQQVFSDALTAVLLAARISWQRMLVAWIYVPAGVLIVLLTCFGIDALISLSSVSFPASVACMILLFISLVICEVVLGDRRTRSLVRVVDVPCGFALRYINIFFTPSFVLLPLSPPVSGVEIGKIIAVFVFGFFAMFAVTAYFVRAMQLIFRTSKRGVTERAEEMGAENDDIPMTEVLEATQLSPSAAAAPVTEPESLDDLIAPVRAQDPAAIRNTLGPPIHQVNSTETASRYVVQDPPPLSRAQRWATIANANIDILTYTTFLLLIGFPVYYSIGYPMPAQLCFNILAYFSALSLPAKYKRFLHPVLVSSGMTILEIWLLALTKKETLQDGLKAYSTKTRYLQLWDGERGLRKPGAGDVFSSILDVSIVALALPMFQYRHELKRHLPTILLPLLPLLSSSLLGYPTLCARFLTPKHALAFTSRSLTLALATPTITNFGGDTSLVAVLCIMSGILGVLVGPAMLDWLKIPEDDYVTRGITLGANSSAIATALLLVTDPRAAAMSSLAMSLFGTSMVILSSIPPVVQGVRSLVGL